MKIKNEILKETIKPLFKLNGFKVSGNHFNKKEEDFVKVVNPQFSQFNDSENVRLTFNIGFYFPLTNEFKGVDSLKRISIDDCQIHERYGNVFLEGVDTWLEKKEKIDKQDFIEEVKFFCENIIYWFSNFNSFNNLLELKELKSCWTTSGIVYHFGIWKSNRSVKEGIQVLQEEYEALDYKDSHWAFTISDSIEKLHEKL
ncbi:DUF4304 domain-containing protein [uncultured Dokdonia sp.]|uniref:DUF4304 domain-containing protein n=1 Tax=uncultured Dokdonia sp. TaxID=575653 RepID=UPI00261034FA|nr:DUF4304 domain-containing protein [uncultured Dokdonia sp.]